MKATKKDIFNTDLKMQECATQSNFFYKQMNVYQL